MNSCPALYVNSQNQCSITQINTPYCPASDEVLVETIYSGINPADFKHASFLGIHDCVMGYDFCGRVIRVPQDCKFKEGDVIAGFTPTGSGRKWKYGTHQTYFCVPMDMAFSVPDHLPKAHAACLSVVVMTTADALYNILRFALPSEERVNSSGPLFIWGASTAVGLSALQFTKASGASLIYVTASQPRHEFLQSLGATRCFDYKDPKVSEHIHEAIQETNCEGSWKALDAIGSQEPDSSADLMARWVPDNAVLASVRFAGPKFKFPYAAANRNNDIHGKKLPARPGDYRRAKLALDWAIKNYDRGFELPVEVYSGSADQALGQVLDVAHGRKGFGKVALQHPFMQ
ncbi:MAG: hypothetical protein M1820_004781 [Bogoriella megaspora]|nr:MAG: hypothetical protein M1820_004781 [Bogoriella megaspora]